ncbi:hypothetical protein C0992_010407, partial [Termitomyces sp. T32_za158]
KDLKKQHGGAGPIQQVHLLKDALTTKFSTSIPLTKTINDIFEKINRAFNVGKVTSDLLKSIAMIAALSKTEFMHTKSIITHNFTTAEDGNYKPSNMARKTIEEPIALRKAAKDMKIKGKRQSPAPQCYRQEIKGHDNQQL